MRSIAIQPVSAARPSALRRSIATPSAAITSPSVLRRFTAPPSTAAMWPLVFKRSLPTPLAPATPAPVLRRSEEHTSELQSHLNLVCRLLLEKKKIQTLHQKHMNLCAHTRYQDKQARD